MNTTRRFGRRAGLSPLPGAVALLAIAVLTGCERLSWTPAERKQNAEQPRLPAKDSDQISDRPPTPRTIYAYARVLAAEGQDGACEALLAKLIAERPSFTPAHLLLAEVRMRSRRIDDAIAALVAGLRASPRDDVLWNNLGICFLMKSDCTNALTRFTTAAALQPSNARYRANMAMALGLMGRNEEALSLYAMVLPPADARHNLTVLAAARENFFGYDEAPPPAPFGSADLAPANVPESAAHGLQPELVAEDPTRAE